MYKVAIIDDEMIFREHLRKTINWQDNDFKICFEARNGVDALEKIAKIQPDIMLVDINMPFMNGLELSAEVKEKYPKINIVLITGYGEFEYARKALKIGVRDYVLKPYDKEELLFTLIRIKNEIMKEDEEQRDNLRERIILRESLFNLLVSNEFDFDEKEVITQLEKFDIKTKSLIFRVSVIEIKAEEDMGTKDLDIFRNAVVNVLNETIKSSGNHITFYDHNGRIISLIEAGKEKQDLDIGQYNELCYLVEKYLKIEIAVGIGKIYKGVNRIWTSYREALFAIQNKFILQSKVIEYGSARDVNKNIGFYTSEVNENILINLRINDIDKVKKEIRKVFVDILKNEVSIDYTYAIGMGLISLGLSYIVETGQSIESVVGENFLMIDEIRKQKSIQELEKFIISFYMKINEFSINNKPSRANIIAKNTKDFIDNNYDNNELNIDRIAKAVYVNSSYLRSIFKKEFKVTVIEYLTNVRMQNSKMLLKSGNLKYTEIANMVGYKDASYFSKCFKKYFGMSPSEYENRIH